TLRSQALADGPGRDVAGLVQAGLPGGAPALCPRDPRRGPPLRPVRRAGPVARRRRDAGRGLLDRRKPRRPPRPQRSLPRRDRLARDRPRAVRARDRSFRSGLAPIAVLVEVFLGDVVFGDLAGPDRAPVRVGSVLDAVDDAGLEG